MPRSLFAAALSLLLAACTTPADLADVQRQLTGRFDWISSSGSIAGVTHTPASEGYEVRLDFTEDRLRAWRDGEFIGQTRVSVEEDTRRASPTPVYTVRYDPPLQVFPFAAFEEHTLRFTEAKLIVELADPCCDRYSHTFSKFGVR
jgi:hypothetical protein